MTTFVDPSLAADQQVVTRVWLQIVANDITYIACVLMVLPEHSVARGAGQPGLEGVVMPEGAILAKAIDGLRAVAPPATGTYLWQTDPITGGEWVEENSILQSAKLSAVMGAGYA